MRHVPSARGLPGGVGGRFGVMGAPCPASGGVLPTGVAAPGVAVPVSLRRFLLTSRSASSRWKTVSLMAARSRVEDGCSRLASS